MLWRRNNVKTTLNHLLRGGGISIDLRERISKKELKKKKKKIKIKGNLSLHTVSILKQRNRQGSEQKGRLNHKEVEQYFPIF